MDVKIYNLPMIWMKYSLVILEKYRFYGILIYVRIYMGDTENIFFMFQICKFKCLKSPKNFLNVSQFLEVMRSFVYV